MTRHKISFSLNRHDVRRALSSHQRLYYRSWRGLCAMIIPVLLAYAVFIRIIWADIPYTPARFLWPLIIAVFVFFALIMAAIVIAKIWVFPVFAAKRHYSTNALMQGRHVASWDEARFTLDSPASFSLKWDQFYRLIERRQHFLLMFDERNYLIIPKNALEPTQSADLRRMIAIHKKH